MVLIPLTRGLATMIDEADAEKVLGYKWHAREGKWTNYACGRVADRRFAYLHRYILGLAPGNGLQVDHIDGNGLNNIRNNLRVASHSENTRNTRKIVNGTSRFKGVFYVPTERKWSVQISTGQRGRLNRITHTLGRFPTEEAAALAYDAKARELFGWSARFNFPEPGERSALMNEEPGQ